jgi:hypothetical protein
MLDVILGKGSKISFFREVLTDKSIGIFIGASLPRRIRVGKEEVGIKGVSDSLVTGEFDAVVGSDGEDLVFDRQELITNGLSNSLGRFGGDLFKKAITGSSLDEREDAAFLLSPDDRIGFPVAKPRAELDDRRPLTYRPPCVPTLSAAIFMDPLPVFVTPS